ncbi:uncharacterized, partial [Tachysurus ichikawai]
VFVVVVSRVTNIRIPMMPQAGSINEREGTLNLMNPEPYGTENQKKLEKTPNHMDSETEP